eukprot:EC839291.1.p4 GENE.EC839291.1~~EC839291.1.p4  ORF type:complete len:65 (-),score=1.57 EC839291.1:245-439(-)
MEALPRRIIGSPVLVETDLRVVPVEVPTEKTPRQQAGFHFLNDELIGERIDPVEKWLSFTTPEN